MNKKSHKISILLLILLSISSCSSAKQEKVKEEHIRIPVVSGQFYPGNKETLQNTVNKHLESVPEQKIEGKLVSLIVPHAGYTFSGQTAAYSFSLLKDKKYDIIVLLGPSHRVAVKGASVYNEGSWKTPLGLVKVNSEVANDIISESELFEFYEQAYLREHSLEVELPFLQTVLSEFQIVPILVNYPEKELCEKLASAIVKAIKGKNALIVASTDMSHVSNDYDKVKKMDKLTCDDIREFDIEGLFKHINTEKGQLCGSAATLTALLASKKLGADSASFLNYTNSYEVTGNKGYVVGYCAFAVTKKAISEKKGADMLDKKQQDSLIKIARETIEARLNNRKKPGFNITDPMLKEKRGAFVTLHKHGNLRGCIGYIMPVEELYNAVSKLVIQSATEDPRFPPVTAAELDNIEIEISVLTVPERISDVDEIELGKHGVIVKSGFRQGVFLPQVATETGWTKEEFLSRLCSGKAGLSPDAWKDKKTEIYTFSAQVFEESK